MKKKILIVAIIFVVILAAYAFIHFSKEESKEINNEVSNVENTNKEATIKIENIEEFIGKVYGTIPEGTIPRVQTMKIDTTDLDAVKYNTGLNNVDDVEEIYVSEALISAQAYSMVVIRTKSADVTEKVQQELMDNINPRKWICVCAEKMYSVTSGDIVTLVMSSEEWAKPVYDAIKKELDGNIGKDLQKDIIEEIPEGDSETEFMPL